MNIKEIRERELARPDTKEALEMMATCHVRAAADIRIFLDALKQAGVPRPITARLVELYYTEVLIRTRRNPLEALLGGVPTCDEHSHMVEDKVGKA